MDRNKGARQEIRLGIHYDNQIIIGTKRFGFDYGQRALIGMDGNGLQIPFDDFEARFNGTRVLLDDDVFVRCYQDAYYRPELVVLPEGLFNGPFHEEPKLFTLNRDCRENGYILVNQATKERLDQGIVPKVSIEGEIWLANGYKHVLQQPEGNLQLRIPFGDDYADPDDERYQILFYDKQRGFLDDLVSADDMLELPKDVHPLRMLRIGEIDPVGRAVAYKCDPLEALYDSPMEAVHYTHRLSWKEIGWLEEINLNRSKAGLPPLDERNEKNKPQRQRKGHRPGHGR